MVVPQAWGRRVGTEVGEQLASIVHGFLALDGMDWWYRQAEEIMYLCCTVTVWRQIKKKQIRLGAPGLSAYSPC